MQINEIMTKDVKFINREKTAQEAARMMQESDIGSIPIEENEKLIGMVTDRDLALKIIAQGKSVDTKIGECVSEKVKYCYEDEDSEDVARQMTDLKIRRMPVMNRDKLLVGFVSLGDLATHPETKSEASMAHSKVAR